MNRGILIAALLAVVLIAAGLGFLIGRRDPAPAPGTATATANIAAPASRAAADDKAIAAPAPPDPNSDPALSHWIVGGWAEASTNCETDTGEYFGAGGRWAATGQEGRWRIENGRMIVTVTHEAQGDPMLDDSLQLLARPITNVTTLVREGPDRMSLTMNGRPVAMMRCPEARDTFST